MLPMECFLSDWVQLLTGFTCMTDVLLGVVYEARRFGRSLQHGSVPGENAALVQTPRQGAVSRAIVEIMTTPIATHGTDANGRGSRWMQRSLLTLPDERGMAHELGAAL
jgi:hypothetical protein